MEFIENQQKKILQKYVKDDSWIKIDNIHYPVSSDILLTLNIFQLMIMDCDPEMHDQKPIMWSNSTENIPYITIKIFMLMYQHLKYLVMSLTSNQNLDIDINDKIKYVKLLNHVASESECRVLIKAISCDNALCAELMRLSMHNLKLFFNNDQIYHATNTIIQEKKYSIEEIAKYYNFDLCKKEILWSNTGYLKSYIYIPSIHSIYRCRPIIGSNCCMVIFYAHLSSDIIFKKLNTTYYLEKIETIDTVDTVNIADKNNISIKYSNYYHRTILRDIDKKYKFMFASSWWTGLSADEKYEKSIMIGDNIKNAYLMDKILI